MELAKQLSSSYATKSEVCYIKPHWVNGGRVRWWQLVVLPWGVSHWKSLSLSCSQSSSSSIGKCKALQQALTFYRAEKQGKKLISGDHWGLQESKGHHVCQVEPKIQEDVNCSTHWLPSTGQRWLEYSYNTPSVWHVLWETGITISLEADLHSCSRSYSWQGSKNHQEKTKLDHVDV